MTRDVVSATIAERDRAIAVLTTAFSSDPVLRWVFPDAEQYLANFPRLVSSFAGKAFENATAHQVDGFEGVALWLEPGVAPDEEAMGALLDERIADERKQELF
ncbi:MAG TPA: GNAT family N-acetyltransferase, partial [Dehalococcoidia bacterium]